MVSEPLKMQQFKAKILRIGKIRKFSTAATLPFTPMKEDLLSALGQPIFTAKSASLQVSTFRSGLDYQLEGKILGKVLVKS